MLQTWTRIRGGGGGGGGGGIALGSLAMWLFCCVPQSTINTDLWWGGDGGDGGDGGGGGGEVVVVVGGGSRYQLLCEALRLFFVCFSKHEHIKVETTTGCVQLCDGQALLEHMLLGGL